MVALRRYFEKPLEEFAVTVIDNPRKGFSSIEDYLDLKTVVIKNSIAGKSNF